MYDLNENRYYAYNAHRVDSSFIPASTFKIFNSLVGIETGIITDSNYIFKWNGATHWNENWNKDLKLKEAFQYSCVPCYQALAREIGEKRMQFFIDKEKYGNQNISGGIDQFWLDGEIRVTQLQQVELLKNLYHEKLSFSKKAMQLVKEIMRMEKEDDYTLYTKTGWGIIEDKNYGWFVGIAESETNVLFFATNIQADEPQPKNFATARINITKNVLKKLMN